MLPTGPESMLPPYIGVHTRLYRSAWIYSSCASWRNSNSSSVCLLSVISERAWLKSTRGQTTAPETDDQQWTSDDFERRSVKQIPSSDTTSTAALIGPHHSVQRNG